MSFHPLVPPWLLTVATVLALLTIGVLAWRRGHRRVWAVRALMVLCILGVLIRPGTGQAPASERVSDLEVLVVVDKTTSMSARDWDGDQSRLDGVRTDLTALTESMPGARFSLVTFGRVTRTQLPFTTDVAAFRNAVETMRREDVYDGAGSTILAPREEMTEVLTRAEENRPERKRVVVFVSDGENTVEDQEQGSFADLAELVDDGIVLGYGTEEGGTMPMELDDPDGRQVYDPAGSGDAVSSLDEENLQRVAEELGVDYQQRTSPGGLDTWADGVDRSLTGDDEETRVAHELFWVPGLALFGLALAELWIALRGFRAAQREVQTL